MKKEFLRLLIILPIIYIALLGIMYKIQRSMIYHGHPINVDTPQNVETAKVTTIDGLTLEGWYIASPKEDAPTIIHFHGNAGNIASRYPKIGNYANHGYNVLLAEYRGFGNNPGSPTEEGLYNDARAYINWIKTVKNTPESNMIIYGVSLGTGVTVQMATEYNEAAIILESPYTSLPDAAKQTYYMLPVDLLMHDKFNSLDKIKNINSPVLILHGDQDQVINVKQGQALFDAAGEPKKFIKIIGGQHSNLYDYEAPWYILDFLSSLNGNTPQGKT